jgi:hypothetical protein
VIVLYEYEERLAQPAVRRQNPDRQNAASDGKIRMKGQRYDEALQYVREATDIFRDTSSHHLPEAEVTPEELQGFSISRNRT